MSESRDDKIGDSLKRMDKPPDEKRPSDQVSTGEGDSKQMPSKKQESDSMRDDSKQMKDRDIKQVISEAGKPMGFNSYQMSNEQDREAIKEAGNDSIDEIQQGQVMSAFTKMKIQPAPTTKKPTLIPECKRSYLEYCLRFVLEKKDSGLAFLKHLFVSKAFLGASQHYSILCLATIYCPDKVVLSFSSASCFKKYGESGGCFSNEVVMSYEDTHSLISILKPAYFLMFIHEPNFSNEIEKKFIENLECFSGKIALVLGDKITTGCGYLRDHLANQRLEFLFCTPEWLISSNAPLKIGHYISKWFVNRAQFRKILRHNIESLQVEIAENFIVKLNERASRKSSKQSVCESLKDLKIVCGTNYGPLMSLLDDIKDRCVKLKTLNVEIILSEGNPLGVMLVFYANGIMDRVLVAHEKIRAIMEKCRPLVSSLKLSSLLSLYYHSDEQFSCDWIKRAKSLDLFRSSEHLDLIEHEHNLLAFRCNLRSEFEDGFLQLAHSTEVVRVIPE